MTKEYSYVKSLVSTIIAIGLTSGTSNSIAAEKSETPPTEKCYGIAKKGMNDCAGNNHPCQSQAHQNGDPGEFLYVLEGTCQKIVGGIKKE